MYMSVKKIGAGDGVSWQHCLPLNVVLIFLWAHITQYCKVIQIKVKIYQID